MYCLLTDWQPPIGPSLIGVYTEVATNIWHTFELPIESTTWVSYQAAQQGGEVLLLDSLGEPGINEQTGYCYAYYTWDESGRNRIRLDLKDPDGYPIPHSRGGFASVTYEYNDQSNITQTSYLGTDGLPINRKDNGVSVIKYAYDESGIRIGTERYDATGVMVE